LDPKTKLWKVWWLGGTALAALTAALIWGAEWAYAAGHPTLEALLGVTKILLYLFWLQAVWTCSRNVDDVAWTYLARGLALAGLAATALLY
jgi:hypothetical protein